MANGSHPARWIRHLCEAVLFLLGFLVFPWLPRKGVILLSSALGRLACALCGKSRRIAMANLEMAFGTDLGERQRKVIARMSFATAARLVLDMYWFSVWPRRRLSSHVQFDPSMARLFRTNPAIAVTGHIGNWEVLSQALAMAGYPYVGIAARLRNPILDGLLNRIRQRGPQRIAAKQGAVREVMQELRRGGRTIVLLDQNTVPRDGGIFVDFFERPVPVSKIVPALAQRTGAKAVFMFCVPNEAGGYTAYAREPLELAGRECDELAATQRIMGVCEEVIREWPGQWQWTYKRWRYVPPAGDVSRYPFYAQPIPEPFLKKKAVDGN